jgi:hypothetical protein
MMIAGNRKAMEMTLPIIVAIVIGLIIIVISIYVFTGKTKVLSSAGNCEASECVLSKEDCASGYVKGFIPCTKEVSGKKESGRCCIKQET